jgi:hypothetical protein
MSDYEVFIVERDNGDFNIFATKDDMFVLQGGLTRPELEAFLKAGRKACADQDAKQEFVKKFSHKKGS